MVEMTVASGCNGASPNGAFSEAGGPPTLPQRRPSQDPSVHMARFGPEPEQLAAARRWCRSATKMPVDASYGLLLVVSEFYTNALPTCDMKSLAFSDHIGRRLL